MNNGKIHFISFYGVPFSLIYANNEINLSDVEWSIATLRKNFPTPTILMVKNVGNYWISKEAQKRLIGGIPEIREMIIIADSMNKTREAFLARASYLISFPIVIFPSIEKAYAYILQKGTKQLT